MQTNIYKDCKTLGEVEAQASNAGKQNYISYLENLHYDKLCAEAGISEKLAKEYKPTRKELYTFILA